MRIYCPTESNTERIQTPLPLSPRSPSPPLPSLPLRFSHLFLQCSGKRVGGCEQLVSRGLHFYRNHNRATRLEDRSIDIQIQSPLSPFRKRGQSLGESEHAYSVRKDVVVVVVGGLTLHLGEP